MALYSAYRINVTNAQSGIGAAIYEIEMSATPGGADLCNGGTASASSTYQTYVPGNAFDNNQATFWSSNTSAASYIQYAFAEPIGIAEIRIMASGPSAPKNFTLEGFNASNQWVVLKTLTNITSWVAGVFNVYSLQAGTISGNIIESLAITDWRITSVNCANGVVDNSAIFSGSTYSLPTFTFGPVNLTLSPKIDYQWSANKAAILNDYVVASNPDNTPHLFKVTTAGTFGATESAWNLSGTTTQGTATLTYVAALVDPVSIGPKIPV